MPVRLLREGILDSEAVNSLSPEAEVFYRRLTRLYGLILGALHANPAGLTVPEIADRLNMPRDTISPRMRPMQGKGYVRCTSEKRIPNLEGHSRACFVWRVNTDAEHVHDHAGSAAAAFDGAGVGRAGGP